MQKGIRCLKKGLKQTETYETDGNVSDDCRNV